MADKTLATFRLDPALWSAFKNMAAASGSNASAVLTEFVRSYLAPQPINESTAPIPNPQPPTPNSQPLHLDNLDTVIDERLDKVLDDRGLKPEIIALQLEEHTATLNELHKQLEELRGKLKAR
jgi:hypothetical protein